MKCEIRNPKSEIRKRQFELRHSGFFRISDFGFRIFTVTFVLFFAPLLLAATNSNLPADIPPLRPPRGEIPPSFWEQHGGWVIAGGCVALLVVAAAIWWLTRPKAAAVLAPETQARQGLESLLGQPEEGLMLSRISQILRHYVIASFSLAPGEYTTAEFCALIETRHEIGGELASALSQFLRHCDQRKFAPVLPQPPLAAVNQALALIDLAEKRRAQRD